MNNYRCKTWQGYLQMVVYYVSRGYVYHYSVKYPGKKKEKWNEIDKKMLDTYKAGKTKFQRTREKRKGVARFVVFRWESACVIMRTDGVLPDDIDQTCFKNIRDKTISVTLSDNITLEVCRDGASKKITVRMNKATYRAIKDMFAQLCILRERTMLLRKFDNLNGLPAWAGIIAQKINIARFIVRQARKHRVELRLDNLRINTKRKVYKVW